MKKILTFSVLAILAIGCAPKGGNKAASFDEVLTTRRSVRDYDATKQISKAELKTLLKAVQDAPSWANTQTTRYYVAVGEEKRKALWEMVGGNKDRIQNAPVLIVSTYVSGKSGFFRGMPANDIGDGWGAYDNGLSNAYLILQARAMGFDTLIMGDRNAEAIRAEFRIPEEETVMAVIALGYRASEPGRPERIPLEDMVKFF